MPLALYRRHRLNCKGKHPHNTRTREYDERKKDWRRCECPIFVPGAIGKDFRRLNTGRWQGGDAQTVAGEIERAGKWEGTSAPIPVPEPPEPSAQVRVTLERAIKAFTAEFEEHAALNTRKKYRLLLRKNGEVVVTDSASNRIYRFAGRKTFVPAPVYHSLSAPNGIALADDGRQLFVADDCGIVRVNLDEGTSAELVRNPRSTLAGVDGLYWHNGSLIAIQNGIGSPRVVAFRLSTDAARVEQTTVLENRPAFTQTPTTGAIRGNEFYFMANSQGDNLNGDEVVDVRKFQRVRVGVLRLP